MEGDVDTVGLVVDQPIALEVDMVREPEDIVLVGSDLARGGVEHTQAWYRPFGGRVEAGSAASRPDNRWAAEDMRNDCDHPFVPWSMRKSSCCGRRSGRSILDDNAKVAHGEERAEVTDDGLSKLRRDGTACQKGKE